MSNLNTTGQVLGFLFPAFLFFTTVAWGPDCLQWVKRTDVGSYGHRMHHAMVYDPNRGVTVFFGGEIGKPGEETFFNDTQEYDGEQWKQIHTPVKPPLRSMHTMIYDPVRSRIVMCAGQGIYPGGIRGVFSDTWLYRSDGTTGVWEEEGSIFHSVGTTMRIWKPDPALVLESADVVTGPWTPVAVPPNPTIVGGGVAKFFRHRRTE